MMSWLEDSMRALVPVAFLVACAPTGETPIAWQSSLGLATRGVALHSRGDVGHAGMAGTNCPFETTQGNVTGDYDLPDEGEEVQDVGTSPLGDETVALVLGESI